jgi:hypothetical protein
MTTGYLGKTVQKEYSNSPTLLALLDYSDQWIDPTAFIAEFLAYVWDIATAQGFGLDILGRILGRSRYLLVDQTPGFNFGFNINAAPGTQWQPWSQAPFYGGQAAGPVSVALQDAYYRKLLYVKAAANIARCDVPTLNSLVRAMFGDRGKCYVGYDINNPMHIGYHFEFFPTPVEKSIIESGIFPIPAGMTVEYIYEVIDYAPFGFAGMNTGADPEYVTGWSQGPFYQPGAVADQLLNNIGGTFILDQSQLG